MIGYCFSALIYHHLSIDIIIVDERGLNTETHCQLKAKKTKIR